MHLVNNSNVPCSKFQNQEENRNLESNEKANRKCVDSYIEETDKIWKEEDEGIGKRMSAINQHPCNKSSSLHKSSDSLGCYHSLPIEFLAGTALSVTCAPKLNPEIGKIVTSNKRRGMKYLRYKTLFNKKIFNFVSPSRITTMGSSSSSNSCPECYDLVDEGSNSKLESEDTKGRRVPTKLHIPGFNPLAQTKAASDDNLVPFSKISPQQFQKGNQVFYSINTDHAAWAPGFCKNMFQYEGRFLPKLLCSSQDDPKRTRSLKRRKLLARKKRDAYKKRLEQNDKRMSKLYSVNQKSAGAFLLPNSTRERCQSKKSKKPNQVPPSEGLKGGTSRRKKSLQKCNELQLLNRGTDCFVNSVVQLLRQTDYASFIIIMIYISNTMYRIQGFRGVKLIAF